MRTFRIPKRSGGVRVIYAPDAAEKETLRALLPSLTPVQDRLTAAHGFRARRGIVTAAMPHVGMAVTISIDLQDFFDHCTHELAALRGVPREVLDAPLAWPDGAARQGLPTSPAVANVCAKPLDEAVIRILRKTGYKVCVQGMPGPDATAAYTRYADDLSISLRGDPGQETITKIITKVCDAARMVGLPVNPRKVRVRRAVGGRREVCGVVVDRYTHPTRAFRRRLRAAEHRLNQVSQDSREYRVLARRVAGMQEFARLAVPRTMQEHATWVAAQSDKSWQDAERIASRMGWRLERRWLAQKVAIPKDLGDGCRITIDPVDFLNMGQVRYVNSQSVSCLRRGGDFEHGPLWWLALPGAALGLMTDDRGTIECAGVRRPRNKARVILYYLRDGRKCYGRFYGDDTASVGTLRAKLQAEGFLPVWEVSGRAEVIGNVSDRLRRPYFDYGRVVSVTLTPSGRSAVKLVLN